MDGIVTSLASSQSSSITTMASSSSYQDIQPFKPEHVKYLEGIILVMQKLKKKQLYKIKNLKLLNY